jgi:pimeloyl-ACP methyl ester carboxylesterase
MLRSWPLRDLVPAAIARLEACDGNALARLFSILVPEGDRVADRLFSSVLNRHIGLSEMFRMPPPTRQDIEDHVASLGFSLDAGPEFLGLLEEGWPTYVPDELSDGYAETDVPILMMNGTLDPQTPLSGAEPAGDHFNSAFQTFVTVPFATHSVLNQSPVGLDEDVTVLTCGQVLVEQFLADPHAAIDVTCTDYVLPPNFRNEALSELVFGSSDPFGADPGARPPTRERVSVPPRLRDSSR